MSTTLKEFLVTFGQQYSREPHPKVRYAHPNGWLSIMAYTYEQAREMAFQELGPAWCFIYERGVDQLSESLFPMGQLHQVVAVAYPQPRSEVPSEKGGFTVVEVMIVIVILGLLAAMAIPAFQKVRAEGIRERMRRGEAVDASGRAYLDKYDRARGRSKMAAYNVEVVSFREGDRITIEGKKHVILKVDGFYAISRTTE